MEVVVHPCTCIACKGNGAVRLTTHDCWGRAEWYEERCPMCNGDGYVIPANERTMIRNNLGL